jgi:hypothetical protein
MTEPARKLWRVARVCDRRLQETPHYLWGHVSVIEQIITDMPAGACRVLSEHAMEREAQGAAVDAQLEALKIDSENSVGMAAWSLSRESRLGELRFMTAFYCYSRASVFSHAR